MEKLHTNALSVTVAMVQMTLDDVPVPVLAESAFSVRVLLKVSARGS